LILIRSVLTTIKFGIYFLKFQCSLGLIWLKVPHAVSGLWSDSQAFPIHFVDKSKQLCFEGFLIHRYIFVTVFFVCRFGLLMLGSWIILSFLLRFLCWRWLRYLLQILFVRLVPSCLLKFSFFLVRRFRSSHRETIFYFLCSHAHCGSKSFEINATIPDDQVNRFSWLTLSSFTLVDVFFWGSDVYRQVPPSRAMMACLFLYVINERLKSV
jgi:hypothetical protein